jgi:hypothetical protein
MVSKSADHEIFPSQSVIDRLLAGHGFGNKTLYSKEESELLLKDKAKVIERILSKKIERSQRAILFIGSWSLAKAVYIDTKGGDLPYICPEELWLEFTCNKNDADSMTSSEQSRKWMPAAHACAYLAIHELFKEQRSFVLMITTTGLVNSKIFELLGYKVILYHFTHGVFKEQDPLIGMNTPILFPYIHEINFLHVTSDGDQTIHTAQLARTTPSELEMRIFDPDKYEQLHKFYNNWASKNGSKPWEKLLGGKLPK